MSKKKKKQIKGSKKKQLRRPKKKQIKGSKKKQISGLKTKQVRELQKVLVLKRDDLLKVVVRKKYRDLPNTEIGDEIDTALQTVEKELLFELTNNEKITLDSIEASLRKIEIREYGLCEQCHKKIAYKRLKVMAWARYCIRCQNKAEK